MKVEDEVVEVEMEDKKVEEQEEEDDRRRGGRGAEKMEKKMGRRKRKMQIQKKAVEMENFVEEEVGIRTR